MLLSIGPQQFLTALVFDGVFARFPRLRGGVIELGAGWVPEYLRTLDLSQKIFKRTDPSVEALPLKASEYIRRAVKFTPFPGEDVRPADQGCGRGTLHVSRRLPTSRRH